MGNIVGSLKDKKLHNAVLSCHAKATSQRQRAFQLALNRLASIDGQTG